jgi:hypothetical protein
MIKLRAFVALVVVVAVAATLAPATPALAHTTGDGVPSHNTRVASCLAGGNIQARPPQNMVSWYGNMENVYWTPQLFKQNSSGGWDHVASASWLHANANRYRLYNSVSSATWLTPNNAGADNGLWFQGLGRGTYAVKQWYYWQSAGRFHEEWQPIGTSSYYTCSLY